VLGRDRAWLAAHPEDTLTREHADAYFALARRRREGEPVAYLTGVREFWGLPLRVSPAVLIPRPETETLVEAALVRLSRDRDLQLLDLGTGSGAIALALAHERPRARVLAVDLSLQALAVAQANAQQLGIANCAFERSDWYAAVPDRRYDLIAANPPYIGGADPHLAEGDLRHEPVAALTPGDDGLAALRTIIAGAPARLAAGGHLVVEHGYDQAAAVRGLFEAAGFASVRSYRDLAGIERVVAGTINAGQS
jgi:release factor glutamine methyltransferase